VSLTREDLSEAIRASFDSAARPHRTASRAATAEADFLSIYRHAELASRTPVVAAIEGGQLADRLAWVFVAGYQAVVRSVFPEITTSGWAAFAATENTREPDRYPAASVRRSEKGLLLSGCKSWIAQSRSVEQLVVTTGSRQDGRCFLIQTRNDRTTLPGVDLEHRARDIVQEEGEPGGQPRFLADMSQGKARFDDVPVLAEFPAERIRCFVRREPVFVMLACLGFMARQLTAVDLSAASALALDLASEDQPGAAQLPDPSRLAALDHRFQELVGKFEALPAAQQTPGFAIDRRLLSLYSRALQKHARP
jgi:hypothetical protein